METITQAVQNAGNAIWNEVDALRGGQQQTGQNQTEQRVPGKYGEEPVSGIQGKGTVNDPYDAGNRDEQPNAPTSKENTAVVTEPLSSITPSSTTQTQTDKANLVTSAIGPTNPSIHHPTPVQRFDQTPTTATGASGSGPAALSTLKDEPVGIHRSILKDEPLTGSKPTATETPTPASAAKTATPTAGAGLTSEKHQALSKTPSTSLPQTTPSTATGLASEKTQTPSTSPSQTTPTASAGLMSEKTQTPTATGTATRDKAPGLSSTKDEHKDSESEPIVPPANNDRKVQPSKEALRGPSVAEPRKSYEEQGKEAQREMAKDEEGAGSDQPKTTKPDSNDKSHDHGNGKEKSGKEEHHHKSMKERINKVLHHH